MGLIKAAVNAASSTFADQYLDYIYCESLSSDVLMAKGQRRAKRGTNKGSENIISQDSIIAVNEGQCLIVVEQGEIIDVCAEAGQYKFDSNSEPSIFTGSLGQSIKETFAKIGSRVKFGGNAANDQRVYYVNTKEVMGNKFGTPTPVPFRVVDMNIGLDVDISVRCNGEYSYRIVDPLLFFKNVAANVEGDFTRSRIDSQLKSEFLTALQPGFAKISEMGVRYSSVPGHTMELAQALNEVLSGPWTQQRGIAIAAIGINSIAASPEDEERIKTLQMTAVMRDPNMRDANQSMATADSMRTAAANENGAMMGFMGMNMAQMAGANMMGQQAMPQGGQPYQYQNAYNVSPTGGFAGVPQNAQGQADAWTCECGTKNTGKFCTNCGKPKPAPQGTWTCPKCGSQNTGKFCMECGTARPADANGSWTCECGTQNTGKFCMNCGKPRA